MLSKEARESWKEFLSCRKYTSQLLHPTYYKQPASSAAAKHKTEGTGSTVTGIGFEKPVTKVIFESEVLPKSGFETNAQRESLVFSIKKRNTELPLNATDGPTTDQLRTISEPKQVTIAETNFDGLLGAHSQNETAKELKPLKVRIKRCSTMKARKHEVETVQVDLYSDSSEGEA